MHGVYLSHESDPPPGIRYNKKVWLEPLGGLAAIAGAGKALAPHGALVIYGPFKVNGMFTTAQRGSGGDFPSAVPDNCILLIP